ncbi:MAG: tetratricopeptide repeat protein [Myxococcota bacterium]
MSLEETATRGIAAIEGGRFDEAVVAFRDALAIAPDRPDLNHALGMAHLHRGEVGEAVVYFEKAVRLSEPFDAPEHEALKQDFYLTLATAYQLLNRIPDAAATLSKATEIWPEWIQPRLQLSQVYLSSCRVDEGRETLRGLLPSMGEAHRPAAEALLGALEAYDASGEGADVFLRAHAESYRDYFDEVVEEQRGEGYLAEAARMVRGADGEPVAAVAEGARPYALARVDLVHAETQEVAAIYTEEEPMIVEVNGLGPLAQTPVPLRWETEHGFEVWVSTRCPWHWLPIAVQFATETDPKARIEAVDAVIGPWYLAGYNGDFGEATSGRFHYVTDPEPLGRFGVGYHVDLGRARFDAVVELLAKLATLGRTNPIRRVLFGEGRLPE